MRIESRDKPFLIALIVLIWLVGMCAFHSFVPTPLEPENGGGKHAPQKEGPEIPKSGLNDPNWWIVGFTGALLLFTWGQYRLGKRADNHFRVTERAYIQMSHRSAAKIDGGKLSVPMQVRNWGATPGRVTKVVLGAFCAKKDLDPSTIVDYSRFNIRQTPKVFLIPSGHFNWVQEMTLDAELLEFVEADDFLRLYVVGYVEYTDQFGGCYRSGYGRHYIPGEPGNNLSYMLYDGFSYDISIS